MTNAPAGKRQPKEKRVTALLCKLSPLPTGPAALDLQTQLQEQIIRFPSNLASLVVSKRQDLDTEGLTLWNLSTRLMRAKDIPISPDQRATLLAARVFAFLLLDGGLNTGRSSLADVTRLMKVALKAAKSCINVKRLDFALNVLEKAAVYESQLPIRDGTVRVSPAEAETCSHLQSEYYVVRATLAWRQDKVEVAEHMYKKAALSDKALDPDIAESLADLLYEMGKDFFKKKQPELADKWLERASNIITAQEIDKLSTDATNLQTSIIQARVQALLAIEREDALDMANSLINNLENEVGDRLIVLLLKLEVLSAPVSQTFDCNAYGDVIYRMIRTVVMTDGNFKLIMHHIRKLNDKGPSLACNILDSFLQSRLFEAGNEEWIEKALVNRMWMSTNSRDSPEVLKSARAVLEVVGSNMSKPLSASATHAVQTLLWKRIESNYGDGNYEAAEDWCRLAMQRVFEQAGDLNKAKIVRKLLLCTLGRGDVSDARGVISQIPESSKDDPMTRFLMFKIAIRTNELELASACLEKIYKAEKDDCTVLYACVLDAQQVGDRTLTIAALQLVFQEYEYSVPSSVNFPALLRCMIRLILSQLESVESEKDIDVPSVVDQLCKLFEGGSTQAQRMSKQEDRDNGTKVWTIQELDWFSKNAYNLSLKYSAQWHPQQVLGIIQSSIKFASIYPKDIDNMTSNDVTHRHIFCDFLAVLHLVSLARAEDNIEAQLQDYLELRKHVDSFDTRLQSIMDVLEEGPQQDLLKKLATLLVFDFEAAIRLKAWDDLTEVILKADCCKSMDIYEKMSDMLLSDPSIPVAVLIATLKRIANEAWSLDSFDIAKLSRYMRCLFRLGLSSGDGPLAESLLEQVSELASSAENSETAYPLEELEYVATTAFNRAVDYYCTGEDDACRRWAGKAVEVAGFCGDGGGLRNLLQEKLVGLQFGKEM
ncbi:sporulation-specific protein 22 [Pseudogymnoascus australis]